jgi:uncharacterized damage-inducible protein DinB
MNLNAAILDERQVLLDSVIETLSQGETLLQELDDRAYTRRLPVAFNASIGGHYRHCLDHFSSLLNAVSEGDLNYDVRERGTAVEHDRFAALNATRRLLDGFRALNVASLERSLNVTCKTSYLQAGTQSSGSTVGREIMYCVAHAVHHYALIGVMAGLMGLSMPAGFGVAPSTLKHQSTAAAWT